MSQDFIVMAMMMNP